MGKILYSGTFGSDDPTRATLPFLAASGALDRGHEPVIALIGEAVYVMKDDVTEVIQGIGIPSLQELMSKVIEHEVPIHL